VSQRSRRPCRTSPPSSGRSLCRDDARDGALPGTSSTCEARIRRNDRPWISRRRRPRHRRLGRGAQSAPRFRCS
jgi:hypothetical protein